MVFYAFSKLPAELRQQIWRAALPSQARQAFYRYQKGCWKPLQLAEGDEGFEVGHPTNLLLVFQHDLLQPVQFETDLLLVNRESRMVAQKWIREQQGFDSCTSENGQSMVFITHYNPLYDALYVSQHTIDDFIREGAERGFEQDLINKTIGGGPARVKYLALEAGILENKSLPRGLLAVLADEWYTNVQELWVVFGTPPEWRCLSGFAKHVNQRWEVNFLEQEDAEQQMRDEFLKRLRASIVRATRGTTLQHLVLRSVSALRR